MKRMRDPLGQLLVARGVLANDNSLEDLLARQERKVPLASLCYVLGYAAERALVETLVEQTGWPGVVVDESVIHLEVLGALSPDLAGRAVLLPMYEDDDHLVVATSSPEDVRGVVRELERTRGKRVDLHVGLEVVLTRAIRACYAARDRGDSYWVGAEAVVDAAADRGAIATVAPAPADGIEEVAARAHRALLEDVTKELEHAELPGDLDDLPAEPPSHVSSGSWLPPSTSGEGDDATLEDDAAVGETIDLDAGLEVVGPPSERVGPARVLIVDDDFATRHFLVKELQPLGYITLTAATGGEATRALRATVPPDLVIADILLPEVDGFRLCRAIKRSRRLGNVPVILMSAVIDSGRVTEDVLARYGADAYLEKPLDIRRVHRTIREILGRRGAPPTRDDAGFARAIAAYQAGDVQAAINHLRSGIAGDPASAKHRFVLANLLQRQGMMSEAIDEYETVVDLEPDYFPALTRLAYLYYKQGLVARAIDTWRRSLALCQDATLRRNIELFMRKLIADLEPGRLST